MSATPESQLIAAAQLRCELQSRRARYDAGAASPAIYKVIREIETQLAWLAHRQS
jgi:hypothetical protein